jgi:glycosyltransferase involved in cell wall biosynthesis
VFVCPFPKAQISLLPENFMPDISVLILSFNDEAIIGRCIESVLWADDIVVLDSYCTDGTSQVVARYPNIRFLQRTFDDFATHRNFALNEINYRHEWIFSIDSDEICSKDLGDEICAAVSMADPTIAVFSIKRREFFLGGWINHNTASPQWVQRVTRRNCGHYERDVHEVLTFHGQQGFLKSMLGHYPTAKGISYWIERHNRYSTVEAQYEVKVHNVIKFRELLSTNPFRRKEAWKTLSEHLPARWFQFFAVNFFIKACFLDGMRGIRYTLIRTFLRYMVDIKKVHIKARNKL